MSVRNLSFAVKIGYELKRAERYRIFLSLAVFNVGTILDLSGTGITKTGHDKERLLGDLKKLVKQSVREVDYISNSGENKIGLLMPETSRQGAEAAARRISESINKYCEQNLGSPLDYLVPVEISSFPDASGTRSIASYIEDFSE